MVKSDDHVSIDINKTSNSLKAIHKIMDKGDDHASIDINSLATSLRGKFQNLYPLSGDCCIYRVPPKTRRFDETLYNPKIVSIGPLHHDREELKAMEEHKLRYLQDFLQRTSVSLEEFLTFIKDNETKLRNCYEETIALGSQEFVEMMLLDAVFLIEFLLKQSNPKLITSEDRIFKKQQLLKDIKPDIWSLENQIPFFILEDFFELAKTRMPGDCYEGLSMRELIFPFCLSRFERFSIDESLFKIKFSEAKHFLDLLRLCLEPPDHLQFVLQNPSYIYPTSPTITELHQAGIKFRVGSSTHLFDIKFDKGTLEIPKIRIRYVSNYFKHLQIFEALHCATNHINDYALLLSFLITTRKDAELLIQNGIIENTESQRAATFCQEIGKHARWKTRKFKYSDLVRDLSAYCRSPWHKWKATLKQNYFNTPWASISVIAAVVLLILTFIQSVCSILAL